MAQSKAALQETCCDSCAATLRRCPFPAEMPSDSLRRTTSPHILGCWHAVVSAQPPARGRRRHAVADTRSPALGRRHSVAAGTRSPTLGRRCSPTDIKCVTFDNTTVDDNCISAGRRLKDRITPSMTALKVTHLRPDRRANRARAEDGPGAAANRARAEGDDRRAGRARRRRAGRGGANHAPRLMPKCQNKTQMRIAFVRKVCYYR